MAFGSHKIVKMSTGNNFRFLLSEVPGAGIAFSVSRKLNANYTGAAFRVRRSSDNSETDIYFVANLTDINALLSFCGSSSGFIVTWYDQSGNGLNLTQATATNQPMIVNTGALLVNIGNKACVSFDGSNDHLGLAAEYSLTTQSIFSLCNLPANITAATTYQSLFRNDASNAGLFGFGSATSGLTNERLSWLAVSSSVAYGIGQVTADIPSGNYLFNANFSQPDAVRSIYQNGTKLTVSASSGGDFTTVIYPNSFRRIGASSTGTSAFNGQVSEFIIYPSNPERLIFENNIRNFFKTW